METKEVIREYNNQFFKFIDTVDEAAQMVLKGKQMVIAQGTIKDEIDYPMIMTIDVVDNEFIVKVESKYPYREELQELFQSYMDYRYCIVDE